MDDKELARRYMWEAFFKRLRTHGSIWVYEELGILNTLKGKHASND